MENGRTVETLTSKSKVAATSLEALQYSQAALNVAHAENVTGSVVGRLLSLSSSLIFTEAPTKTERHGEHVEAVIGINDDEVAHLTMTKEAYDALIAMK